MPRLSSPSLPPEAGVGLQGLIGVLVSQAVGDGHRRQTGCDQERGVMVSELMPAAADSWNGFAGRSPGTYLHTLGWFWRNASTSAHGILIAAEPLPPPTL